MITEEECLLSCLLSKPEKIGRISAKIKPEYFEREINREIYATMNEVDNFNIPTLVSKNRNLELKKLLEIDEYIKFADDIQLDGYAYCVLEKFKQREIKRLLSSDNLEEVSSKIDEIKNLTYFDEVEKNESDEFLKNVEQRYRGEKDERLIKTGFRNLDYSIDGFRKSEFVIIGGRPGAGKTTIGMNLAYQMAKDKNKVLFFSLEMGKIELHERLVKSITKITDYKKITEPEFEKIVRVSRAIKERLPLDVCDKPGITIEKIIYETKTRKPDVVFIDHLSILKSAKRFNSRYEEVSYLSARLKQLAREFDIPVVCLCQLNRALEGRELKAPTMADLRDSGSIEQDADIVCFVYRPEYHLKDKEPDDKNSKQYESWLEAMQEAKGKAQFILAKNRRGLLGRFDFGFDGATYTFYERDR